MKKTLICAALVFMSFTPTILFQDSCASAAENQATQQQASQKNAQPLTVSKNPDVQAIKPKKPVNIKLHRNAGGQYSWDISGSNADEVYRADSRLKKLLKIEE